MPTRLLTALITTCLLTPGALAGGSWGTLGGGEPRGLVLDTYEHGRVMNGVDLGGVTLGVDNFHSTTDLLVAFDTTLRGTRDPDLQGPNPSGGSWSRGNLSGGGSPLGTILIIQEVNNGFRGFTDASNTVVSKPDDEGRRRGGISPGAGEITFDFDAPVKGLGFTLVDVEETGEFNNETGFFATFQSGGETAMVSFKDFVDAGSPFYDPTVVFGNNSANRIGTITAEQLGLSGIDRVTMNFGGSGGVGGLQVTGIPTPGAAFGGVTMMGILLLCRRERRDATR